MQEKKKAKKGMSIKWKLILMILPVVLIALNVQAFINGTNSQRIILERTASQMDAVLGEYSNEIAGELEGIRLQAESLAATVGGGYKETTFEGYDAILRTFVSQYDNVLGSGLWFEPRVYDKEQEYYGPYWYKEMSAEGKWTGNLLMIWDYSNAEYDYFNQEYYLNAKAQSGHSAVITDPYYDATSGLVMASCSAPIRDQQGNFLGCVTVDLQLTRIQEELGAVKIGETGSVWLIGGAGGYIYHPAVADAASRGMNITESTEMGTYVDQIRSTPSGSGTFSWEGKNRLLYWRTVSGMDWKMGLTIEEGEVLADVASMTFMSTIITILAMVVCAAIIIWQASGIAKEISRVEAFAEELAKGDFAVDPLEVRRKDEIGAMSVALNTMFANNADVIRNIGVGSTKVSHSSTQLSETSSDLLARFEEITATMTKVNDAMSNTGAATEQVSASANEVNEAVEKLADETSRTKEEVINIRNKAAEIEREGKESSEYAIRIANEKGSDLEEAAKRAKVVEKIGTLAESIAEIAEQINLLSLNASIEAARAGEHGRGFAVVASEINKLATDTQEAVGEIQATINEIQGAVNSLSNASAELLTFMRDTVSPDYQKFITIGQQYGQDAQTFGDLADRIAEMVSYIAESMEQVNEAVASIAEGAQETSSSSAMVTGTISESSELMERVSEMAGESKDVSENLDGIVRQFKLK